MAAAYAFGPLTWISQAVTAQRWLVAWIGGTDHDAAEGRLKGDVGPIAAALQAQDGYDKVYLLTNYEHERSVAYCGWLARRTGLPAEAIDLFDIELPSPVDYDAIYAEVTKNLAAARLPRDDVQLTFHLSPGTPAMTVIWIVLARTRFPARLIQTTRDRGVQEVKFFTDVADAFLPEYLQRGDRRIEKLAAGPKGSAPEFAAVVHGSQAVAHQIELARRMAAYDVPILILGETGTGKELFADAIHRSSRRAGGPFVPVNCGAVAPELANSELFGHAKGAFTGAVRDHKGHFQAANGGTLFLDEIGDLPLETQVRLLRVLQSKTVTPVGGAKSIPVDVRILAATHGDLAADVAAGRFREDLFHRLAVGILNLPPLRERGSDVELLIDHFMAQINDEGAGKPESVRKNLSVDARKLLIAHAWPGNIRELYHTLMRAVIWSRGEQIEASDIHAALLPVPTDSRSPLERPLTQGFDLEALVDEVKTHYIRLALDKCGGKKTAAARLLGFSNHQTLGNWMKRLGIASDEPA
jgi:DNA-binding NtrC family response regulator